MPTTVGEIAGWVNGTVSGAPDTLIVRATSLTDAGPGDLTLVDGPKRRKDWEASPAAAAVVPLSFADDPRPLIRVADPLASFVQIVLKLRGPRPDDTGIHPTAVIHPSVTFGANPTVGPNAVIGEGTTFGANARVLAGTVVGRFCTVGDDVTLFPRVVLYDDCRFGNRVIIHSGAVIGADGFGYRMVAGKHTKVPQLGNVVIEDDVEVGANTTIDRATFGSTRIGSGTKIDNLVQIAHNCRVGRHNIIVSQVGMGGSCTTGEYVTMAGQVGMADHLSIGDKAILGARAGLHTDVEAGAFVLGAPAMPGREFMRVAAEWKKAAGVRKDVERIKKQLGLTDAEGGA